MSGDKYYSLGEKNITGFFKFLYNYQKAFNNFIKAGECYYEENNIIKSIRSYKKACDIYDNNFNENQKKVNKDAYDKIMSKSFDFAKSIFVVSTSINKNKKENNNQDIDEDTR
jgi:hypothetical protein